MGVLEAAPDTAGLEEELHEQRVDMAALFWTEVARHIPDWALAKERKVSAADLRRDYVHSHALGLAAIARADRYVATFCT